MEGKFPSFREHMTVPSVSSETVQNLLDLSTDAVSLLTIDRAQIESTKRLNAELGCDGHILLLNKVMIRSHHFPTPVVLVL